MRRTRPVITAKPIKRNDRASNVHEQGQVSQHSLEEQDHQVAAFSDAMTTLQSTINNLNFPVTYRSIEIDAVVIAKAINKKFGRLLEQRSELEAQLSARDLDVGRYRKRLQEVEKDKQRFSDIANDLAETVNQLRVDLRHKEKELEAKCNEVSRLTQRLNPRNREDSDANTSEAEHNQMKTGKFAYQDRFRDFEAEHLARLRTEHRDSTNTPSTPDLDVSQQGFQVESSVAHVASSQSHSLRGHGESQTSRARVDDAVESAIRAVQQQYAKGKVSTTEKIQRLERRLAAVERKLRMYEVTPSSELIYSHKRIRDLERQCAAATSDAQAKFQPRIDRLVATAQNATRQRDELWQMLKGLETGRAELKRRWDRQADADDRRVRVRESPELRGHFWNTTTSVNDMSSGATSSRKRSHEESPDEPATPSDFNSEAASSNPPLTPYGNHSKDRNADTSSFTRSIIRVPGQPPRSDVPQWDLADLKRDNFTCAIVPQAIVRIIKQQVSRWDSLRADWFNGAGAGAGKAKCAERHAIYTKSVLDNVNEACSDCTERGRVCVKLAGGKLEPLPLPLDKRGQAGTNEVQYWKWTAAPSSNSIGSSKCVRM